MTTKQDVVDLINLISLILDGIKVNLTNKEKEVLSVKIENPDEHLNKEQGEIVKKVYANMIEGFLSLAVEGYRFTDLYRIKQEFGKNLRENYPEASESFLKFAETFWTLKIRLLDFMSRSRELANYIAYPLLFQLELQIAGVFFPTPGVITVPSNEREKAQREILKDFDIDIEDFIKGNPILIRDRRAGI